MSKWYADDIDIVVDGARLTQQFPDNLPIEKWGETYDRLRANATLMASSKELYDACKMGFTHLDGPVLLRITATILEKQCIVPELAVLLRAKADAEEKAIRLAEGKANCNADQDKISVQVDQIRYPDTKSA